jgi:hypothetical protein
MELGCLSWGCVIPRLDLAFLYPLLSSLGGLCLLILVVLVISCGGEENQCVRGVCVRVCSIWGCGINMVVMLKRNMGQYLHVLVVCCMSEGCCGSSSGSRASLEGCVVVGTVTILPYRHLLYFHTCFRHVYFSLGNVNSYFCLKCVLHCFMFCVG